MSLSCTCDTDNYEWLYYPPRDFSILQTKTRKKCRSCGKLIEIEADCLEFIREEYDSEIEEDLLLPTWYHCEECGGLYFALEDLGFCVQIDENMQDLVQEYNDDYA